MIALKIRHQKKDGSISSSILIKNFFHCDLNQLKNFKTLRHISVAGFLLTNQCQSHPEKVITIWFDEDLF